MTYPPKKDDTHCCRIVGPMVIQEWTGAEWKVVDTSQSQGLGYRTLDPATRRGEYVGQQVRTPCD